MTLSSAKYSFASAQVGALVELASLKKASIGPF